MLSSPGIGSGLDVNGIVSQLMVLEQRPLVRLQLEQESVQVQISALGQFKTDLGTLKQAAEKLADAGTYDVFNAASSNESVLTGSASATAAPASHSITVTQLAQRHRLASGSFTDPATDVGNGTLNISVGADQFSLAIDPSAQTLNDIRDAINAAGDNTGVTASIINVTGGSRLVLTANDTGLSNAIEVTVTGDGDGNDADNAGLSALVYEAAGTQNLSQLDAALDATFTVDGFAATSASNVVSGVIEGVSFELFDADPGGLTATLTVSRDTESITGVLGELAGSWNGLLGSMKRLGASELRGESMFIDIERQVRNLFASNAELGGALNVALDAGFDFDGDGFVSFEDSDVTALLKTDFSDVVTFFSDSEAGFATRLETMLEAYVQTGGVIDSRNDNLSTRSRDLGKRMENMQFRLGIIESRLLDQFGALDGLVASLQTTSSFLSQQLASLPGASSS